MPVKSLTIERRLKQLGFTPVRQQGSHMRFKDTKGNSLTLPTHKGEDTKMGVIWNINRKLKQWGYNQLNLWG